MSLLPFVPCSLKIREACGGAMVFVMLSIPLMILVLALFIYPSYSEGKQIITGEKLYSNQEPKIK